MSPKAVHLRSSSDYVRPLVIAKNIRMTREQAGAFVRRTRPIFRPFSYEPKVLPEVVRAFVWLKDIAIGGPRVLENPYYPVPEWLCRRSADAVQLHGEIAEACERLGGALQKKSWLSLADKAIRENIERAVEALRPIKSDDQLFYNPRLIKTFCLHHDVTLIQFLEASNRVGKRVPVSIFKFKPEGGGAAANADISQGGVSIGYLAKKIEELRAAHAKYQKEWGDVEKEMYSNAVRALVGIFEKEGLKEDANQLLQSTLSPEKEAIRILEKKSTLKGADLRNLDPEEMMDLLAKKGREYNIIEKGYKLAREQLTRNPEIFELVYRPIAQDYIKASREFLLFTELLHKALSKKVSRGESPLTYGIDLIREAFVRDIENATKTLNLKVPHSESKHQTKGANQTIL